MDLTTFDGIVIGSGGAGGLTAPNPGTQDHLVDTGTGRTVTHVWWTPLDNIGDLTKFTHIQVRTHERDIVRVTIGGNGQPGLLRLRLHLVLGRTLTIA